MTTKAILEKENMALRRRIAALEKRVATGTRAQQKQPEHALRKEQWRLKTIIENAGAAIWSLDTSYRLTMANSNYFEGATTIFGHEIKLGDLMPPQWLPDSARAEWQAKYDRVFAGESFREEIIVEGTNSEKLYREYTLNPVRDSENKVIGAVCFGWDITERKRAEEKLRESERFFRFIATNSPDVIFFQDRDLRYEWLIHSISNLPLDQIIGKTDLELFPPHQALPLVELKKQIMQTGEGQRIEVQLDVDGVKRWHDATYQPTRDHTGQVTGIACYVCDITEHKRAEQERERLLQEIERGREQLQVLSRQLIDAQEQERRNLARELHDEIGQALTAVKINLQAMQRSEFTTDCVLPLEFSINTIEKTLQQVRQLSLDLHPALLDDLGLVSALRWYLDHQTQGTAIIPRLLADELKTGLTAEIQLACFRVAQEALTNVLRHAQATQILVELREQDAELDLIIRDDGIGFDVMAARTRALHGETLGLVGMQERVELIGGYLEIESALGFGTEIHVHLPLDRKERPLERRREQR